MFGVVIFPLLFFLKLYLLSFKVQGHPHVLSINVTQDQHQQSQSNKSGLVHTLREKTESDIESEAKETQLPVFEPHEGNNIIN